MMKNSRDLIDAIEALASELDRSGKNDPARFFRNMTHQIKGATDKSSAKGVLEQLAGSGTISQYANFSHQEDKLYDRVFNEASRLLKVI